MNTQTDTLTDQIAAGTYVRDYGVTPSLNNPASYEEARLAMILSVAKSLSDPTYVGPSLDQPITASPHRTAEQTRWLNDARESILAKFGDVLKAMHDDIDLTEIREARGQ